MKKTITDLVIGRIKSTIEALKKKSAQKPNQGPMAG
jgi:hypothetical protein